MYILKATNKNAETFYYTGRAGDGWISKEINGAFLYTSLAEAMRKSNSFNGMTPIHGLSFSVIAVEHIWTCPTHGVQNGIAYHKGDPVCLEDVTIDEFYKGCCQVLSSERIVIG